MANTVRPKIQTMSSEVVDTNPYRYVLIVHNIKPDTAKVISANCD